MAIIKGTSGNDSLRGSNSNDTITGFAGNDTVNSFLGQDEVNGGLGIDLLVVNYSTANDGILTGGPSFGFYQTAGLSHFVSGWSGTVERFNITGTAGNDIFSTDNGSDTLIGGLGNDCLDGAAGADVYNGGSGIDTLVADFSSLSSSQSLSSNMAALPGGGSFTSMEAFRVTMGAGNDSISLNTPFDHLVNSGDGNDQITTGNGNDTINSGAGADIIATGLGQDQVQGGTGLDLLIVNYSKTNDGILTGGRSFGFYQTAGLSHFVTGWSGTVERFNVTGTAGNDSFSTADHNDTLIGGDGNDSMEGAAGVDVYDGGAGIDTLIADFSSVSGAQVIRGGSSALPGGGSFTRMEAFQVTLGNGNDTFSLATAFDHLVNSGAGSDRITTGGGNDTINAGDGADVIATSLGQDQVNGGAGIDLLVVDYSTAVDGILTGGPSNGFYQTAGLSHFVTGWSGTVERFNVTGTPGNDSFSTGVKSDTLNGGAGNDSLDGGEGADKMAGGKGNDRYLVDHTGDVVTENAAAGTDSAESSVSFKLKANVENLTLTGANAINATGNASSNEITGNSGNNILDGTGVAGGAGEEDSLTGGAGEDLFVLGTASARYYMSGGEQDYALITDFEHSQGDQLQLRGSAEDYLVGTGSGGRSKIFFDSDNNQMLEPGSDELVSQVLGATIDLTQDVRYVS